MRIIIHIIVFAVAVLVLLQICVPIIDRAQARYSAADRRAIIEMREHYKREMERGPQTWH